VVLSHDALIAEIRARRQMLRILGRPHRRRGRTPRQRQPNAIRLSYFRSLLDILAVAKRLVDRHVPVLRAMLERTFAVRTDAIGGDNPNEIVDDISNEFFREFTNTRLAQVADSYARQTSAYQRDQMLRQFRAALGIDIVKAEPWLEPMIGAFTADNVALIKSIPNRYFDEVEKTIVRAMRTGLRWEEVAADIDKRFEVAEGHARLVARDQVGKFMAETNAARQADLGIEKFIWRTANDNRVRDSHAVLDGETFRWDKPPVVDGAPSLPGMPINCRCEAEPVLGPLLKAVQGT
jgi:SPP1 gp7 family putative phage head morphogenesis protein